MLLDLIKASWKPLLLIALVSITITWAFNIENQFITTQTINNIQIRTFNAEKYLTNISNAWNSDALQFADILPPVTWQTITENITQSAFWQKLVNNIAFIADWAYFPINFILWLLRWVSWLLTILLALIGWNTGYTRDLQQNKIYYSELVKILNWVTQNLMIPYINP